MAKRKKITYIDEKGKPTFFKPKKEIYDKIDVLQ